MDQNTPVLLDDPVLGALAKKHKRSPALIALRYLLQRGLVVLAKSFSEKRIKENLQVMSGALGTGAPTVSIMCVFFVGTQDTFVVSGCPCHLLCVSSYCPFVSVFFCCRAGKPTCLD